MKITQIVKNLQNKFNLSNFSGIPDFEIIDKEFFNDKGINGILVLPESKFKKENDHSENIVRGAYLHNENFGKLLLFTKSITKTAKGFVEHINSIYDDKGFKIADRRNLLSFMNAEKKPEFIDYEELITKLTKIELLVLWFMHNQKKWESDFWVEENKCLISGILRQICEDIILNDSAMSEAFYWINTKKFELPKYCEPVLLSKNLPNTKNDEWGNLIAMKETLNLFPLEKKIQSESWEDFLIQQSSKNESIQNKLVDMVKGEKVKWNVIKNYLSEELKHKYRGKICAERFNL